MHQKHKINSNRILHSIPINKFRLKKSKQLRCLSYSIPLVCMLALFGLFVVAGSVGGEFSNEVYAAEGDGSDEEGKLSVTISGDLEQTTPAVAGETAYRSHNVQVNGSNIDSYTMQISYGSSSTLENTPMLEGTEPTTIEGANGRTSASTDDNWWGYAWDNNDKAEDTLTFQTMPQYGSGIQLEGGKPTDGTVSVDKTLTFAAKFGSDAAAGHYKADVLLSLAASPKKVVEGITDGMYMQDITPEICQATPISNTQYIVKDKRDEKSYTIARIKNNTDNIARCWMTSNLAFDIKNQSTRMTTELADVSSDKSAWASGVAIRQGAYSDDNNADQYTNARPTAGSTASNYKNEYGYYYSWCAATAGSCSESMSDDKTSSSRSASMSICPKGWKLPTGGVDGEYQTLLGAAAWNDIKEHTVYSYYPAGYIVNSGALNIGSNAFYWTSTSGSADYAYRLYYDGSTLNPGTARSDRYYGFSVRCVAANALEEIYTMQEMTADICAKAKVGDTATLIDVRDNKIYTVAKIKNAANDKANCWMTSNLTFDVKTQSGKMTTALSDVTEDKTIWANETSLRNGSFNGMATSLQYSTNAAGSNKYKTEYGYYYSWCTATAGTCNENTANQPGSRSASMSICPKGWQIPTGGPSGQMAELFGADDYNSGITVLPHATASPYSYQFAGNINSQGIYDIESAGYYWTSSSYSSDSAYQMYMNSSKVWPANVMSRYVGLPMRCVAVSN